MGRGGAALVLGAAVGAALCACFPAFEFQGGASDAGGVGDATPGDGETARDAAGDGAAGDGGTSGDGEADAGRDAGPGCRGTKGSGMARFDVPQKTAFCIDRTEVTARQLSEFLVDPAKPFDASYPFCAAEKAGPRPTPEADPSRLDKPAVGVTLCLASAYCAWAGKRLCGRVGGGPSDGTGALDNEWVYACSNGVGSPYPYGSSYDATRCNTEGDPAARGTLLAPPGSRRDCHGTVPGFEGIFDMSGNAAEFDDYWVAQGDAGQYATHSRGGWVTFGASDRCDTTSGFGAGTAFDVVGFRCCADGAP